MTNPTHTNSLAAEDCDADHGRQAITTTRLAELLSRGNGETVRSNLSRIRRALRDHGAAHGLDSPLTPSDDPDVETWANDDADEICLIVTRG